MFNIKFQSLLLLSLILPLLSHSQKNQISPKTGMELRILNCHDGDTCKGQAKNGVHYTLRLLGIDAPEVEGPHRPKVKQGCKGGQPFAREARDYLNNQLKGKIVWAELYGSDIYRRHLTILRRLEGRDSKISLNEEIVAAGLAHAYRWKGKGEEWALRAENRAKKLKLFLWGQKIQVENPSNYRQRCR